MLRQRRAIAPGLIAAFVLAATASAQPSSVFDAVLPEANAAAPNISTNALKAALAEGRALLLDTRPHMEWAVSHIPRARNVAPKPGMAMAAYTSDVREIERLTGGNRAQPLIVYCNGPFCGKSSRVAEDLVKAGYRDVRRYQLGAPVWRALGNPMVIEPDGAAHVHRLDRTAVWIDARAPGGRAAVAGSRSIPQSGLKPGRDEGVIGEAKNDGRLPMEDHNTRIIVFGENAAQARAVADAIAQAAFHNVTYFEGTAEALGAAIAGGPRRTPTN